MKSLSMIATLLLMLLVSLPAFATTDGIYGLNQQQSYTWDGTVASRLAEPIINYYDFAYGDEATVSFTLPWSFTFYGQPYSQITADTNGNIWFGAAGASAPASSFTLAAKGPVIAAWNSDQSSYYTGGVFVQHKTNPERVVIEWQGETYTEEGLTVQPNNFEVVLFPNGDIRVDYKSFSAANPKDFGSGISSNDGTHSLAISNITGTFVPVYQLAGSSYGFTTQPQSLQVNLSGTGGGTVTSSPVGIACNTNCTSTFPMASQIALHPAADQFSIFTGWTNGTCSGLADCLLTLSANTSVTAGFNRDTAHQVYLSGGSPAYYSTIQASYDAATNNSTIKLWATDYTENITCNLPIAVTLQGGFDGGYATVIGTPVLHGSLTINDGTVTIDGLTIE
jgi:hypothetical protein